MSKLSTRLFAAALLAGGIVLGLLMAAPFEWTAPARSEMHELEAQGSSEAPPEVGPLLELNKAFTTVAGMVKPSVVTITSERVVRPTQVPEGHPFREFFGDDFLDRFRERHGEEFRSNGLGSGVIVSSSGLVMTNNHVIADADEVIVVLEDERELEARVVGTDPATDLALLQIDAKGLPAIKFGDSDAIEVGEWVLAVGSPFNRNLSQTVTAGIVSAKGRQSVGIVDFEDFIQTDAAINPGNSGGALINVRGELVGINTAIATRTGGGQGVGFAIPINMARKVMDDLLAEGRVIRGWLGVVIRSMDEDLAAGLGYESKNGVLINDLTDDGPADRAGVERGDVIVKFEGVEVRDADHLQNLVAAVAPGTGIDLRVWRDGRTKNIEVELGERPQDPTAAFNRAPEEPSPTASAARLGLMVEALTPGLAREHGLEDVERGIIVTDIRRGSPAALKNIRTGDLLLEVNRQEVETTADVERALGGVDEGDSVLLLLRRGATTFYTAVKMPPAAEE